MKAYKKYYIITEEPEIVYKALTNEKVLQIWTGFKAIMQEIPNTEFELWDGNICGMNLEFEQNKKIVQEWFFGDLEEKSIVTIKLHEHKKGTSIELNHVNIPEQDYEDICNGWDEMYFAELKDFFKGE